MYRVLLERTAEKDLARLSVQMHGRVIASIQSLARLVVENLLGARTTGVFAWVIIAWFTKSPTRFESFGSTVFVIAAKFIARLRIYLPLFCQDMDHSPGFLKIVNEARPNVKEITIDQAKNHLHENREAALVDVREDSEWQAGHAVEAQHLGRGVLERDIERMFPEKTKEIIFYCGGGYRSILAAEVAQRMGYTNVFSLIGGYKGLVAAQWPMTK